MHDDEVATDAALVIRLVAARFPDWAGLPVEPVESIGTDNAMYRLGDALSVRLPRIHWAVAPLEREFEWLPRLAPQLPFATPVPVALGVPGEGYPWPWTVCRWLDGTHPVAGDVRGADRLATDLARFVRAMRALDPAGAPRTAWPRPLHEEDGFIRTTLAALADELAPEFDRIVGIWEDALAAPRWSGPLAWIHGDLSPGNLLVRAGRLTGVLDFGAMGVGDPASDLRVAWNLLPPAARSRFRSELGADAAEWRRARGWALLQALAQMSYFEARNPPLVANARHVIAQLVGETAAGTGPPPRLR
jgi:aminoglycoside phosphotransferase (APT) family kinase protein